MAMSQAAMIVFTDLDSHDEATVVVRYDHESVAVSLSKRSEGDVEVFMTTADAKRMIEALRIAVDG